MLNETQLTRKAELVGNLIRSVCEYYKAFNAPIPLKVLSAKYAKALNKVGGFTDTIDELFQDGTFEIVLMRSGGKAIYPEGALVQGSADGVRLNRG